MQNVISALTVAYNLLVGGLLVPITGGIFWRRATGKAALASMSPGRLVVIALMLMLGMLASEPLYWGLAASAVTFVAVSLLRPKATPAGGVTKATWPRLPRNYQRLVGQCGTACSAPAPVSDLTSSSSYLASASGSLDVTLPR